MLLILLVLASFAGIIHARPSHFVVFGDSYTVKANDVINGKNWVDYLQASWENLQVINMAEGGAKCTGKKGYNVDGQISVYLGGNYVQPANDTLYSIMIGVNDVYHNSKVDEVVDCIGKQVLRLQKETKTNEYLLFNMVPFHMSPRIISTGESNVEGNKTWIEKFNQLIIQKASKLQLNDPKLKVVVFDVFHAMKTIVENPTDYGFDANVTDWYSRTNKVREAVNHPESNNFYWLDTSHPTSAVHAIFAKTMANLGALNDRLSMDNLSINPLSPQSTESSISTSVLSTLVLSSIVLVAYFFFNYNR